MTTQVIMISLMRSVAISELKSHLSENLRRVKKGESILVTERGRPIAVVQPFRSEDAELQELIETGVVRPRKGPLPADFWERERASDPEGRVVQALLDERRQGW